MMIARCEIMEKITDYLEECKIKNRKPTRNGIAVRLGVASQTIYNVCTGYYNYGRPYTDRPTTTRRIDNVDFELIKGAFGANPNIPPT